MKKKILIIFAYIFSLFVFFIIAELNVEKFMKWYVGTQDYGNMLIVCFPSIIALILHFVIMCIIVIISKMSRKIDTEIKNLISKLPIATILLYAPMLWSVEKLLSCQLN